MIQFDLENLIYICMYSMYVCMYCMWRTLRRDTGPASAPGLCGGRPSDEPSLLRLEDLPLNMYVCIVCMYVWLLMKSYIDSKRVLT